MTMWTFFGKILPERIPLSMSIPLDWTSEAADFGLRYRVTMQIADGQFIISTMIESGEVDVHTLRNLVENDIRLATDLVGYQAGISYDVDIISAASAEGSSAVFGINIPVLQQAHGDTATIDADLFAAVAREIAARLVLADIREAIRIPVGTGFFCYRAIEAMMQSMKNKRDDKDGPAWDMLRSRLQVDRSAINAIKKHADYPRHGKIHSVTDEDRTLIFRLTDEIVRRFFAYLRDGKKPLTALDFPLYVYSALTA